MNPNGQLQIGTTADESLRDWTAQLACADGDLTLTARCHVKGGGSLTVEVVGLEIVEQRERRLLIRLLSGTRYAFEVADLSSSAGALGSLRQLKAELSKDPISLIHPVPSDVRIALEAQP
ncbi:MAG: hypothetical protein QOF76_1651 [Solirubrobacteraceae bacterium]|jgi:hypothetical protein|nr:hypothetical protein [Solirubrobacteraceae bacterium]